MPKQIRIRAYESPLGPLVEPLREVLRQNHPGSRGRIEAAVPLSMTGPERSEAIEAFDEFVKFVVELGSRRQPLSSDEKEEIAIELTERAAAAASAQGLSAKVFVSEGGRSFGLELLPGGGHRVNRFIRRIDGRLQGLRFEYRPRALLDAGFDAAFVREIRTIFISHRILARLDFKDAVALQHELRHARRFFAMIEKRASPFYGIAVAGDHPLPGAILKTYEGAQSFDEAPSYAHSLGALARRAIRRYETGEAADADRYFVRMARIIQHGLETSIRNVAVGQRWAAALRKGSGEPKYRTDASGITWADAESRGQSVQIPLIASDGEEDPRNREILREQLGWLVKASKALLSVFRVAQKAYDVCESLPDARSKLLTLKSLTHLLRSIPRRDEHWTETLDFDAAMGTFLSMLKQPIAERGD